MKNDNSTIELMFTGDTYFGEGYAHSIERCTGMNILHTDHYDHFYEHLLPIFKGSNIAIANLEVALTDKFPSPFEGTKQYIIRGDGQKTIDALKNLHIDFVSLANNHSNDYGTAGLIQTLNFLDKNDIKHLGAGISAEEASKPLFLDFETNGQVVPVIILAGYEYNNSYDHKYGFYAWENNPGVNVLLADTISTQIKELREKHKNALIIFYPHWGRNYKWKTKRQTSLAHAMIDAGVDLIIGHGAHAMQEIEQYKGKWIVYSLGNFIFNSPGRFQLKNYPPYSFIAKLSINQEADQRRLRLKLYPIVSDNRLTNYHPRMVNEEEFLKLVASLENRRIKHGHEENLTMNRKEDEYGRFLEIDFM